MSEVYKSIAAVQGSLAKTGIAKDRRGQGYQFRGIDDVYEALAPLLASNDLCIIPRMMERVAQDRPTKNGGVMINVTVKAEFDFVSAKDGSKHTASTYGEAMDVSDKATNKAMSAAYKYAAFMTFSIPTEGDNDADANSHQVASPETLSDDQRDIITTLANTAGVDLGAICESYNVKSLNMIPAVKFDNLESRLKATIAEKSK